MSFLFEVSSKVQNRTLYFGANSSIFWAVFYLIRFDGYSQHVVLSVLLTVSAGVALSPIILIGPCCPSITAGVAKMAAQWQDLTVRTLIKVGKETKC